MSNEVIEYQDGTAVPVGSPFATPPALGGSVNAGAVAIESERAIAEARGQIQLAKMFPRDLNAVYAEVMEACKLSSLASVAFYTVPQGGQKVTGPSIKLIEQIAASMENMEWGHRELSRIEAGPGARDFGRSEIEVFAWDKQKNTRSIRQITVLHVLDTKDGPRKLRDQRDIDNKIANVASKQMRGRLQALLPKWLIEAATEECRKTLAGNNDQPISVRVRAMTQAFAKFGVTADHIERYLGHKLDEILADELVDLQGVYNSIKDGTAASEFFGVGADDDKPDTAAAAITAQAKKGAAATAASQNGSAKKDSASQKSKPSESESKPTKDAVTEKGNKADASPQPKAESQEPPANQPAQGQQQEDGDVF